MLSTRHVGVLLLVLTMLFSACTGEDDDASPGIPGFGEPATPTADAVGTETQQQFPPLEPFPAGDAGSVVLEVDDDQLTLVEVRANEGWVYLVDENDDEIQIDFNRNGTEIDFEAVIDDIRLEVDVCTASIEASGDVYTLAEAGEVEARLSGGDLELVEVRPAEGWIHEVEEGDEEIEVVFGRGDQRVTFDLEVENGTLNAMTCTRTIVLRGAHASPASTETINVIEEDDGEEDEAD